MDIEYKGGNCVVISTKQATIVVDPKISPLGLKDVATKDAVVIATQSDFAVKTDEMTVDQPGEYEIKNISIVGVPARRMIEQGDEKNATMYRIVVGDVAIAIIGHVSAPLDELQLEKLGVIDIAIVPVGGSGYTLDAHQAIGVVRQLDPKMIIPTHYADSAINYEVPQMELEPFLKELSATHEAVSKLKIKNGILPDVLTVTEIQRTA